MRKKLEKDFSELKAYWTACSWVVLLAILIFGFMGYIGHRLFGTPVYTATTQVYVYQANEEGLVSDDLKVATQLQWDFQAIIKGPKVADEVIQMLNLGVSVEELCENLTVEAQENTRVMNLCYTDTDPVRAALTVNTVRELAVRKIQKLMDDDVVKTLHEAQIPQKPSQDSESSAVAAVTGAFLGVIISVGGLTVAFFAKKKGTQKGNYLRRRKENGSTQ